MLFRSTNFLVKTFFIKNIEFLFKDPLIHTQMPVFSLNGGHFKKKTINGQIE